ncbi:GerW family sporulation protein [Spirosoma utsteinense]|uniref:Spore protein YtfJ n=1 Tax=Spirosoma utsteinense TaxID=2585773 RepID=A0ABR6W4R2_9BACT|nr:spore germination protein GerW family protein [Spirosoma utsteinense]MBC3784754.1 putative spore protein YtfJ [Spirosoma utsteinense]MBC3791209.1 putative spore protein YtfJ [Spirosoma utsteinense]
MTTSINEVLNNVTEFLRSEAKTDTVIGQSFQLGIFSCVPVIRIGMGFGFGGGEGEDKKQGHGEGSGAGAGYGIEPIGFLVSKDDQIQFIATKQSRGLSEVFEKMPDLLEKFMNRKQQPDPVVTA